MPGDIDTGEGAHSPAASACPFFGSGECSGTLVDAKTPSAERIRVPGGWVLHDVTPTVARDVTLR